VSSLVVQTSFIGDVILTTPLIARLAERGPVDVVTTPIGATLLRNNPAIRSIIPYDKRRADRGLRGFLRIAYHARPLVARRETGKGQPRAVHGQDREPRRAYLAQGSVRSALLALTAGYHQRVGFDTSTAHALYTERVEYRDDWHHARRLLSLADWTLAEGADKAAIRPRLYPGAADVADVDRLLDGRARPFIVLAPGSVWATKRWPYFDSLAELMAPDLELAVIGSTDDATLGQQIVSRVRSRWGAARVIDAVGKLSLLGSAELIGRAAAIVTNDSSPQHMASAMGTPTVTVFGPTVPTFGFGPLAPHSQVVGRDGLECRPCDRHGPRKCPLGHWKCMRDVTPNEVYDIVKTIVLPASA